MRYQLEAVSFSNYYHHCPYFKLNYSVNIYEIQATLMSSVGVRPSRFVSVRISLCGGVFFLKLKLLFKPLEVL